MRRLPILTVVLWLALLPAASAKEVTAMRVCGREGCETIAHPTAQRFHEDASLYGPEIPRSHELGPVRWLRLVMVLGDGAGETIGRMQIAYSPGARAIASIDAVPPTPWQRVSAKAAALLGRSAAGLRPFPPRRFGPEAEAGRPARAADDDGGIPPLLAGVPAVALLLGLGLLVARRR